MIDTFRDKALQAHIVNLERQLALCKTSITSTDRLAALHLNAARALMNDLASNAHLHFPITDIAQPIAASIELMQSLLEKATAYSRELFDIMTHVQKTLGQLCADQHADVHTHLDAILEKTQKLAPVGTETAVAVKANAASGQDNSR